MARSWDADSYHKVSGPMEAMGAKVVDRLPLQGDEVVLDAGCGTGRVTRLLASRLPEGRVIAVDLDPAMVERARTELADLANVEVRQTDLVALEVDEPVDAVLSTATFHWILDHERLFDRLFHALEPGGTLVAQCGGAGNIANVLDAAAEVGGRPEWREFLGGWERPTRYATAEQTEEVLRETGFVDIRCWLEPAPQRPEDPFTYLSTICCGAHLEQLPEERREDFVRDVIAAMPEPDVVEYVRLNIDARRPTPSA